MILKIKQQKMPKGLMSLVQVSIQDYFLSEGPKVNKSKRKNMKGKGWDKYLKEFHDWKKLKMKLNLENFN